MLIHTLHPKYAFLFRNHKKYQLIYEFGTQAEYDSAIQRGFDKHSGYYIGYPGSITTYVKTLMSLADGKIPVITVFHKNESDIAYIFKSRMESLSNVDGIEVLPLSRAKVTTQMWKYMVKNNRHIHSVAAVTYPDHYIGTGIDQYFYIKEDLKYFKELTKDSWCICGSHTWKSLPNRKLPGRFLMVITHNDKEYSKQYEDLERNGVFFINNIDDALISWLINENASKDLYCIGGQTIFEDLDPFTTYYHITEIVYEGKNVPWKEGDAKYDFNGDPHCSHENEILIESESSDYINIPEHIRLSRDPNNICTVSNDPLKIKFQTYVWKSSKDV